MSPEVLGGETGHSVEVDWWSLGCIFYELAAGIPPFHADTPEDVFENVLNWKTTLPLALNDARHLMSDEFVDFILQ